MSVETVLDKIASITGAIGAIGAVIVSYLNFRKIGEVHIQINSRMDQLLKTTGLLGKAEGKVEGKAEEKQAQAKKNLIVD
jgi:hypothetical protein